MSHRCLIGMRSKKFRGQGFLSPFLNNFCSIILLNLILLMFPKGAAIRKHNCYDGMHLVCSKVGGTCPSNIKVVFEASQQIIATASSLFHNASGSLPISLSPRKLRPWNLHFSRRGHFQNHTVTIYISNIPPYSWQAVCVMVWNENVLIVLLTSSIMLCNNKTP